MNGEGIFSEASILGSGAVKLLGFFARTGGLTGTFGFAARLTLGGPGVDSGFASLFGLLLLGIGGGGISSDTGLFGMSAACRNALIRASNAGVVVLLILLAWPLLAESPVLSGVSGAMSVAPVEGLKSSENVLCGDRGEFTLTVGGDGFVGVKDTIDTGLSPDGPLLPTFSPAMLPGVTGLCSPGEGARRDCPLEDDLEPISALLLP